MKYDFEQSVGYWLTLTYQSYTKAFQQSISPHGITLRQAQVLGWLTVSGPLSQRELAERMLIEPPNLVGVLDRMQHAQLIERRVSSQDRRKKLIHPLPAAEELWEQIAECGRGIRKLAVAGMSPAECETLHKLLNQIQSNLSLPITNAS